MLRDIETREDIAHLMLKFYSVMLEDEALRPIFVGVAQIDLDVHLPILTNFWQDILLGTHLYKGNPMQVHLHLNSKHTLTKEHFNKWLTYFNATLDALHEGQTADKAKIRALSIATVMQIKLAQQGQS